MMRKGWVAGWLIFMAVSCADAAHITDKLLTGFYEEPDTESTPVRLLSSGEPLDVLQREGDFSKVRLSDNTTGWVESAYITEEKPANAMLLEAQAELTALKQELADLRRRSSQRDHKGPDQATVSPPETEGSSLAAPLIDKKHETVSDSTKQLQLQLQELQQRMRDAAALLATESQRVEDQPIGSGLSEPVLTWWLFAFGLILAFLAGMLLVDYRNRKRHGGFRI